MGKWSYILLATLLLPVLATAQLRNHSFKTLDSLNAEEARPTVVFLHTDWCKVCHRMEATTFANEAVIEQLNSQFHFVSMDAEGKDDITYRGHTFRFRPTGRNTGVHELAEQLGTIDGQLNYPTLVALNTSNEIVFQYGGLMDAKELLAVLEALLK